MFGGGFIADGHRVFAITFSPDGRECFYTQSLKKYTIMTTREVDGA